MKYEKIFKQIPFIMFFFFVTVPILNLPRDMWDGTIIEYASIIDDFSGLKSWFLESAWFFQYPFSLAIIKISKLLNISYQNTNALIISTFMFLLLREVFWLAENQIKLSKPWAYFALALVATFSTWANFFSSVTTFHFGCMLIGLIFVRKIHTKTINSKLIWFIALVISLNLQSQLVFLPVLSYIYDFSKQNRLCWSWFIKPSKQTTLIFVTCIIFYLVVQIFFPPHGLYENYNKLVIDSFKGLAVATYSFFMLSTYLVPIFFIIGCVSVLAFAINNKIFTPIKKKCNPNWLLWLLVIFFAGLFPYAAVGKYSALWSVDDWASRQAFLLVIPTCLFTTLCLQFFYENFGTRLLKNFVLLGGALIFLFHLTLLMYSVVHKSNRQVFVIHLENLIKENESKIRPGLLEIVGDSMPTPWFRPYESNFLMYSATGKANWWTRVSGQEDEKFVIPYHVRESRDYQIKFVYNYEPEHAKNHTIVEIKISGFLGALNAISNFLGINPSGAIELIRICSKSKELDKVKSCN